MKFELKKHHMNISDEELLDLVGMSLITLHLQDLIDIT
jgi:hypothetical protein